MKHIRNGFGLSESALKHDLQSCMLSWKICPWHTCIYLPTSIHVLRKSRRISFRALCNPSSKQRRTMPIEACYDPFTAQPTLQCFTERLCKVVVTHTHISAKTLSRQEVTVFLVDSISSGFFHSESSHILLCTPFWCLWREALQLLLHCRLAFVATPGARGQDLKMPTTRKKNQKL